MVDHAAGQGWSSVLARLLYGEEGAVGVCVCVNCEDVLRTLRSTILTVRTTQEGYEVVEGELRDAVAIRSISGIHSIFSFFSLK